MPGPLAVGLVPPTMLGPSTTPVLHVDFQIGSQGVTWEENLLGNPQKPAKADTRASARLGPK